MIIAGVDPGLSGAIAILKPDDLILYYMPTMEMITSGKKRRSIDCATLGGIFAEHNPDQTFVEKVGAMPGQGVTSMFNFGRALGSVEGVVGAFLIPINYVTPQRWKKHFNLVAAKDASRARALQMFPKNHEDLKLKKDDGKAEAALIAEWGRRFLAAPA